MDLVTTQSLWPSRCCTIVAISGTTSSDGNALAFIAVPLPPSLHLCCSICCMKKAISTTSVSTTLKTAGEGTTRAQASRDDRTVVAGRPPWRLPAEQRGSGLSNGDAIARWLCFDCLVASEFDRLWVGSLDWSGDVELFFFGG